MFHLLVFLSLLVSNAYDVTAITLDASLLTQLGYNNQSNFVSIYGYNITEIDPNAFKGYINLQALTLQYSSLTNVDLELFKEMVNLFYLNFSHNPSLTKLTNSKKLIFPFMQTFYLDGCSLESLDSNVIYGLPNLTTFSIDQLSPLKTNQLSSWKKLLTLFVRTKNQTSLTKEHFNGLNWIYALSFSNSNIKTIEVHTLLALPGLTYVDFSNNDITAFEYLQIPTKLKTLKLQGNKMNYFMLSRTMGAIEWLFINNNLFRSFKSMDFTFLANLTFLSLSNNPHAYPNEIAGHMKPLVNLTGIEISNLSISSIDSNFFKQNIKLERIDLSYNKISVLPFNTFSHLKDLSTLDLSYNQISILANRTFSNLSSLYSFNLNNNFISEIDSTAFTGSYALRYINLDANRLSKILPGTFENLTLFDIRMNNNQISEIDNSTFAGMNGLSSLFLSRNIISRIDPSTFSSVKLTDYLDLSYNRLTKIENDTFLGQDQLSYYIDLSANMISTIEARAFNGLTNLQGLYLSANMISTIENGVFNSLTNLQYVHLEYNNLIQMDNSTFAGCNNLKEIYLYNNPNLPKSDLQSLCPTTSVNCKVYY